MEQGFVGGLEVLRQDFVHLGRVDVLDIVLLATQTNPSNASTPQALTNPEPTSNKPIFIQHLVQLQQILTQLPLINIHGNKQLKNIPKFHQQGIDNLHHLHENDTILSDFGLFFLNLFLLLLLVDGLQEVLGTLEQFLGQGF